MGNYIACLLCENRLKIRLLKKNDLSIYFAESSLAKLIEYCKEISVAPKEVLFNGFGVLSYQKFYAGNDYILHENHTVTLETRS